MKDLNDLGNSAWDRAYLLYTAEQWHQEGCGRVRICLEWKTWSENRKINFQLVDEEWDGNCVVLKDGLFFFLGLLKFLVSATTVLVLRLMEINPLALELDI